MPLVFVKKEEFNDYTEGLIKNLIEQLPEFVAEALTVLGTDGELTEKDIEVYVSNFGPKDIHYRAIEITVFANDYPERRVNLNERRVNLVRKIQTYNIQLKGAGSVWILLCPGSYGTF